METLRDLLPEELRKPPQAISQPSPPSSQIEPTCIECRDTGRREPAGRSVFPGRSAFCRCEKGEDVWGEQCKRMDAMRLRQLAFWIEKSGIPTRYIRATFSTFPSQKDAGLARVRGWAVGPDTEGMSDHDETVALDKFVEEQKDGLYLYGSYGTGKTGLAIAAMKTIADFNELRPMFLTTTSLLDRIRRSFNGEKDDVLEEAQRVPLLVLDDIGAERVTEWVEERLFALINERYNERRMLICTSNMGPEELAGHIGERTAWRLMEMCAVIELSGKNLRLPSTPK